MHGVDHINTCTYTYAGKREARERTSSQEAGGDANEGMVSVTVLGLHIHVDVYICITYMIKCD